MIPSIICYQHVVHIADELWSSIGDEINIILV